MKQPIAAAMIAALLTGCAAPSTVPPTAGAGASADRAARTSGPTLAEAHTAADQMAQDYIRLSLEADTHEAGYVDAYYGPPALRDAARANPRSVADLLAEAHRLVEATDDWLSGGAAELEPADAPYSIRRRLVALHGMASAAITRLEMIGGRRFPFAEEAQGLFGVEVMTRPLESFDPILARLETLIPGDGPLATRVNSFNDRYVIPADRLRAVFDAAIGECRRRTAQHIALPAGESFTMHFVTDKPWSGYNYYLGNFQSRIEINTDLPIRISRAVDLGCHEGYPGHHVLNLLVEQRLARGGATGANGGPGRPWPEYLVNPLYSPTSVLSEGSANYGIDLAFPGRERLTYDRDVLYPLAGLNPATAERYWEVQQATDALGGARLTIARMLLDGEVTREQAITLTERYLLVSRPRAEQSVTFTDTYRSYVLNYGWGRDLVRQYVERCCDAGTNERWRRMEAILGEPTTPGDLRPR